jgi:hypothetical protein
MDRIQELLGRLADLTDPEVAELEGLILTEFESAETEEPSSESVERMVSLADALDGVRGEVRNRNERAEELAQKAKEASARVHTSAEASAADDEEEEEDVAEVVDDIDRAAEDIAEAADDIADVEEDEEERRRREGLSADSEELSADAETETTEAETEAELSDESAEAASEDAEESEGETELSAEDQGEEPAAETDGELAAEEATTLSAEDADDTHQEDAVTASIESGQGVVVTPPADAAPVPTSDRANNVLGMTITAGGDIPGYTTGAELKDMETVSDAFAKRLHTLSRVQSGNVQQTIATLSFEYDDDRRLGGDDPSNIRKVRDVVSPVALTAAAGLCAPLEQVYDVEVCGDADRPIRDALARFNADRGGIEYYGAPTLGACTGIWDPAAPATKNCCDANCPTKQTVQLEAIYACLKFSNYTNRFFPEVVKANTDLAMINHARSAELNLIGKIFTAAGTSIVTPNGGLTGVSAKTLAAGGVGVARQLIVAIHSAAAYLRRKHRLSDRQTMRVILPNWMEDALVADLALQMPGDGMDVLNAGKRRLQQILDSLGVVVTWSLDNWTKTGTAATAPAVANGGFDAKVSFPIFPEGSLLFLDGGTLDLGVTRDGTMLGNNEYATFVESFEGVAMTGCEILWVSDLDVCVSGAAAALVDTTC